MTTTMSPQKYLDTLESLLDCALAWMADDNDKPYTPDPDFVEAIRLAKLLPDAQVALCNTVGELEAELDNDPDATLIKQVVDEANDVLERIAIDHHQEDE
jgi:hypothetical protein